jgi:hypothetical protein
MMIAGGTNNLLINTTTDAGFKLDVNGTARVQGNAQFGTGFYWDNTNGRLGIGTSTPSQDISVSRTIDGITSISLLNASTGTTASSRFYLGTTNTQVGKLGANYTAGSILKSGDLFMYNQTVGNITFWNNLSTGNINFTTGSATTAQMTIASTGNVLLNTTTDAGYKLDVNGTARVNNDFTIGSNRYLKAFRWTQDDVTKSLQLESNSNYNVDSVNVVSFNNNLLNNTKNFINIGLASTVQTQSSGSNDAFNSIYIQTAYNFPFGTHAVKGIYYNPTLTAMVGTTHHAFHSTSGRIRFEGLPTSPAGLSSGDIWNNLGILTIV